MYNPAWKFTKSTGDKKMAYSSLFEHMAGCTPLELCSNCTLLRFVENHMSHKFDEFVNLMKVREAQLLEKDTDFSVQTSKLTDPLDGGFGGSGFTVRILNCLSNENVNSWRDLVKLSEGDLLRTPNFGRRSINTVKEILAIKGWRLGMLLKE